MEFIHLLHSLSSADNNVRSAAENTYNMMKQQSGDDLPINLLNVLPHADVPIHIRKLAAVLLRGVMVEQELSSFQSMSPQG